MGKRSNFERRERDFYPTPESAVLPLLPHLEPNTRFSEPCAGDGALIRHLEKHGHFKYLASDIEPQSEFIMRCDAMILTLPLQRSDCVITNPPWDRHVLHPMIEHFRKQTDTWLLFDADWWHTKQARPYKPFCEKVVSVGRVKWIEGSKSTGKDNCAWYLFVKDKVEFTKLY